MADSPLGAGVRRLPATETIDERLNQGRFVVVAGGRLAFTTWETQPPAAAPEHMRKRFVPDYRPVLEACGLGIVHHAVPDGWLEQQLTISRRVLEHQDALTRELGAAACALLCAEAREDPQWLQATRARRVVVVAEVNS